MIAWRPALGDIEIIKLRGVRSVEIASVTVGYLQEMCEDTQNERLENYADISTGYLYVRKHGGRINHRPTDLLTLILHPFLHQKNNFPTALRPAQFSTLSRAQTPPPGGAFPPPLPSHAFP